jgi:hypothetical protein
MSRVALAAREIVHSIGDDVGMKQRPVTGQIFFLHGFASCLESNHELDMFFEVSQLIDSKKSWKSPKAPKAGIWYKIGTKSFRTESCAASRISRFSETLLRELCEPSSRQPGIQHEPDRIARSDGSQK